MNLQMLKKAMLAYVSAVKFVWSAIAYPLSIVGKKLMNLRGYRVYGNSVQDGTPTPDSPVEIESVGDLSTKNLFDKTKVDRMVTIVEGTDDIIVTDSGNIFLNHVNTIAMLKPSTTYTISFDIEVFYVPDDTIWKLNTGSGGWFGVLLYSSVNNAIRMIASGIKEPVKVGDKYHVYRVFTTPDTLHEEDANFFMYSYGGNYVKIDGTYGYASGKSKFSNFQIREGEYTQTEMDEYEPYNKYKIPVVARGKNLLSVRDMYSTPYSGYGLTISQVDDYTLEINGEFTGSSYVSVFAKRLIVPIAVDTTKKYSITCKYISGTTSNPNNEYNFVYFNKANDVSGNGESNWTNISIDNKDTVKNNISINNKYIYSMRLVVGVGVSYEHYRFRVQIVEGTTTTYEPYIAPVTKNIYLDEPLRKVGDYADYIDFEKQKVVRNVNMCGIEQAKGLITSYTKLNALQIAKKEDDVGYMNQSISLSMLSNLVEYIVKPAGFDDSRLINKIYVAGVGVYFIGLPKTITTKEEAVEYLASFKLYYRRTTATEESVTLPALPQFKGTTIYEVGTNIKPSGMEAKYC